MAEEYETILSVMDLAGEASLNCSVLHMKSDDKGGAQTRILFAVFIDALESAEIGRDR